MAKSHALRTLVYRTAEFASPAPYLENSRLPLRWQEVALPLMTITLLIILKYLPSTAHLPLSRAAGVVAFGYAAFLALRLLQPEEAIVVAGGTAELRPSIVEYFAC